MLYIHIFALMNIESAIQQKEFKSNRHKLDVNMIYTGSWLMLMKKRVLSPFNLSPQQFNILRILRGSRPKPCSLKVVSERMLDKSSNTSRLVDKLLDKKWVDRVICPSDRRKVEIEISEEGLEIVEKASMAIEDDLMATYQNLTDDEVDTLNRLLNKIRR